MSCPLDLIRANNHVFSRRGSVVASYRIRNGRRHGPYYRLAYLQEGRQVSHYIGRSECLAQRVRNLLDRLQKPRNDRREETRAKRRRKANLLLTKRHWQKTLRVYGLYSRGWAVRGLRARGFPHIDKATATEVQPNQLHTRRTNRQIRRSVDQLHRNSALRSQHRRQPLPLQVVHNRTALPTPQSRNWQKRLVVDQLSLNRAPHRFQNPRRPDILDHDLSIRRQLPRGPPHPREILMTASVRLLSIALALATLAGQLQAECNVWTVTNTTRVLRDAAPGDQSSAKLAAAKNEWESFQILLRSDAAVSEISIEAGDLTGPGGATIPASQARLYRQHQFELTVPTVRNDNPKRGWYPDALIPFRHPESGKLPAGARLVAVPFDLPADQTHGFWVDVFAPPDARPGDYQGSYRVTAAGKVLATVPINLTVWDFELPRVSTMATALGSPAERLRGYYAKRAKAGKEQEPADYSVVDAQCAELLSRHRINASPPPGSLTPLAQPDGSFVVPAEQIDALRTFIDRYHVNALHLPHPRAVVKDPQTEGPKLRAWLAAWDQAAAELDRPNVVFYFYLKDEPNDEEAYKYVQLWGRAIRQANSVAKVMVVEQTWTQDEDWGDLYGAVDIWCPLFPLFKAESAARRQALGETIWTYTALCQRDKTPWWHTDFPLLHYRVPAWIAWRYRIRGILYWGGMVYWNDVEDPWTDPGTLDRRDRNPKYMYNGEGSLLYPGRAVGYDGVAPSIRLKALRDSIEDYEYLAILERAGQETQAQQIVTDLAQSWFEWETDPGAYEKARARLAEMILARKK